MHTDGNVIIGTKLDTTGFEKELEEIVDFAADYSGRNTENIMTKYFTEMWETTFKDATDFAADYGGDSGEIFGKNFQEKYIYELNSVEDFAADYGSDSGKAFAENFNKELEQIEDFAADDSKGIGKMASDLGEKGKEVGKEFAEEMSEGASSSSQLINKVLTKGFSKATGVSEGLLTTVKALLSIGGKIAVIVGVVATVVGIIVGAVKLVKMAIDRLKENNKQFITDLQYISWAIQQAIAPALDWIGNIVVKIIHLVMKAIKYVAALIKMLTGYNIFDNASAQKFAENMQNAEESAGGISSDLKDAKKQLAGFDEMNVLTDSSSSGGGGGIGLTSTDFTLPTEDFSDLGNEIKNITGFVDDLKKDWKTLGTLVDDTPIEDYIEKYGLYGIAIKGLLQSVYGQWEIFIGQWDIVGGLYDLIVAFFTGDQEGINKALNKMWEGVQLWAKGSQDRVWGVLEILAGLVLGSAETTWNLLKGLFEGIGQWIWDNFLQQIWEDIQETFAPEIDFFTSIWEGIKSVIDTAKEIITNVVDTIWSNIEIMINNVKQIVDWVVGEAKKVLEPIFKWVYDKIIKPIITKFDELWTKIKDGVQVAVDKVKSIFNSVVSFFKGIIDKIIGFFREVGGKVADAIGGTFKNVINNVLKGVETILNSPIRAINGLIGAINKIPGLNLTKLNTFSFPRLAKGGIVNMPGRGVPIGSAIAGERGQEAVLPLTDSQQMELLGQSIGKYITINANITNTMNGRVISKELQKIQAENDFAFNK